MIWLAAYLFLIHEWYEPSCCGNIHCQPVTDGIVSDVKEGVMVLGIGILSYSDPRLRWSQDNQDHLCIDNSTKPPKLLCVYRKPKDI